MESVYGKVLVPKPLYQSDEKDEHFVGTSFIIMDYVEVSPSTHRLQYHKLYCYVFNVRYRAKLMVLQLMFQKVLDRRPLHLQ